jgi:hypothetical protein
MHRRSVIILLIQSILAFCTSATAQVSEDVQEKVLNALHKKVPELSGVMMRFEEHFQADTSYTNRGDTLRYIEYVEHGPGDGWIRGFKNYYYVYIGEDHVDHASRWYTFLISKDLKKFRYYDTQYDKIHALNYWKKLWPATKFLYLHKQTQRTQIAK